MNSDYLFFSLFTVNSCYWLCRVTLLIDDRKDTWFVINPVPLIPKVLFRNKWSKKTEGEPASFGLILDLNSTWSVVLAFTSSSK